MVLDRIKQFIDTKGISVYAFEKKVGISNASFAHQLKKNGSIGSDKLEDILNIYPELSAEWLLRGEGSMIKKDVVNIDKKLVEICKSLVTLCEQKENVMGQLANLIKNME